MGLRHKIEGLVWSKPPTDPAERKLLIKLDAVILTYTCLSYFSNYLGKASADTREGSPG
jgi:ACS family pantothenate transporter-like MFS transporter